MTDADVTEIEFPDQAQQKGNRFPLRLDQGQHDRRIDDTKRNPWNPRACADINHPEPRAPGQHRPEQQGGEEETRATAGGGAESGENVSGVRPEWEAGPAVALPAFLLVGATRG